MGLLQMSFSGAIMIAAVVVIRTLALNRLPKKTFLILWGIVLLRLMVPFSIPSVLSVYSLAGRNGAGILPGQILPEQVMFTGNGGNGAIDDGADTDSSANGYKQRGDNTHGDNVAIIQQDSGKSVDGTQALNGEDGDLHPHAASDSKDSENDSRVIMNGRGQSEYENDTGVSLDAEEQLKYKNDTDVSFDAEEQLKYKNDTDVSSLQLWQKRIQQIQDCIRQLRPLCFVIWCAGVLICISCFAVCYLRCRLQFRESLPVEDAFVQKWVQERTCRRPISVMPAKNTRMQKWLEAHPRRLSVRQSDRISTPLTYGIFHPVILMPKCTDWENRQQLRYVLMHEYVHIRRGDALTKLLVTCALCVHWFNPMVWLMWVLFNRDVEISCDESVLRHMGESSKSAYAMMLIQMEAKRGGIAPLCSGLLPGIGKNVMEERITAIMKTKKKSIAAMIVAAALVISVTTAFATSAAENNNTGKKDKTDQTQSNFGTGFTEQEYRMLLALQFDGYEDMSISAYRDKVWTLTDTQEYNDIIERFFQDEDIYAAYETTKGTDSNETANFLYNVLGPILSGRQSLSFNGYAVTDFASASENASLEYTGTLTILDAKQLTVGEYISVRHRIEEDMGNSLQGLSVSELRDEELMKVLIDETILNLTMTYRSNLIYTDIEYVYRPINGVAVDDMGDFAKERRDDWDKTLAPYVPFGLTYRYDWATDDYKMYFNGKEVRGIYDGEENVWISEHMGIGEDIYAADAIELFVVYENHKIAGLREATAQEMAEITARRQAVTDEHQNESQEIRRTMPATEEDYRSLFILKTSDYQQKSITTFNMEYLDWCNESYERMERIGEDRGWDDYCVALTDEEKSFVELTTWLSGMENAEYVRSLNKNEPERDICNSVRLSDKVENAQSGRQVWCSLDYCFAYHIGDKEKVRIGERDGQIGKMMREIQDYWESSDIDEIVQMTEGDMLELLHTIAAKYSSRNITITILDDQTQFERMDERDVYEDRGNIL